MKLHFKEVLTKMIIGTIKINIMKKIYLIISLLTFLSCGKDGVTEAEPRVNCGKITRLWSQNSSADEGNPCGDNRDSSRQFAFIVKNDITGNEKHFCINSSVYIRYKLGSIYCDDTNLDGW
jgi:hypothetical protein